MATFVNFLRLTELATGEGSGTWGTTTNQSLELIGEALGYATQQAFGSDADATTTVADGASDPARAMYYKITSAASLTATRTLTIAPNTISRVMFIENATTGSQSIAISQGSGASVTIATGKTAVVYLDGAGATAAVVDAMAGVDPGVTDTLTEVLVAGNTSGGTNIELSTTDKVQFRDAAIYLNSSVDGQLDIVADTEIQIAATTVDLNGNLDVSGTALVTGVLTTTAATVFNGGFASNADSTLGTDKKVQFRDSAIYINSSVDGQLDIVSDTEIQIAATTIDVNGTLAFDSLKGTGATTVTNILDEDNMASDSATAIATQQSIKAYVDSQVGSFDTLAEVLAQGNTTGGTDLAVSAGDDITFTDTSKAIFGAGSDLQIYHDGSNSYIQSTTGNLNFTTAGGAEFAVTAANNGAVTLFHDGSTKLATTATGIDVTGTVTADGLTVDGSAVINQYLTLKTTDDQANGWLLYTGITDKLEFNYNGSGNAEVVVDTTGNVGIGTTTPAAPLSFGSITNDVRIYLRGNTNEFAIGTNGSQTVYAGYAGHIFQTGSFGGTERMRIDASGNVGIGTSSPSLENGSGLVIYNASAPRISLKNSTSGTTGLDGVDIAMVSSNAYFHNREAGAVIIGTTGLERMRIDASGNVGINVISPADTFGGSGTLDAAGPLLSRGQIGQHQTNAGVLQYGSNVTTIRSYGATSGSGIIAFNTGGGGAADTERMRIDASGNLLVGDTTAAARLWVKRTDAGNLIGGRATNATYTSTVGFFGADRNTTDNSFHYIDCYNYGSSTYRFRVADSGNATNTNNSYGALSDVKLKENIIDSGSQWDDIKALRVRKYSLKSDSLDAPNKLGVIAQELESVGMAGLVSESEDRDEEGNNLGTVTKTVAYSVLYMKAVKALQEAMERIETLEAKVAALES
jgi:hypothetical protein